MMEADRLLAERLQTREREELIDEEKGKLFMELMEKRRKYFAELRAQEKRNKPPTRAQKRTQMSTYIKHMSGYTYKQLKGKSFDEIQKLFDKEMKRVNTFMAMGSEVQERNEKKVEGSEEKTKGNRKKMLRRKRARKEQQQESSKKQRMEEDKETDEVEEDDEAELKKHLVIKQDDDIAIDAIPLATKPPVIVDYRLLKEGIMVHYQLITADGSSKRYSSMIKMLQGINRDQLGTTINVSKGSRNQLGKTIKSLRSDHRGEYISQEFLDHLKEQGIIAYRTSPYTPQHNGVSERRNRTLLGMVHSMMSQTTLPKSFWDYALESAACILNMVPSKKVDKTPYELWHGQASKLSYLKVWGYPKEMIGYSFYYPPENKFFVARNAEFLKNSLIAQQASGNLEDLEIIQEEDTHPSIDTSLNHEEDDQENDEPQSDINTIHNEVWELVDLPPNGKTVGHKWLFIKKTDMDGAVHTYKARLVAKGFTQTLGIDYEETVSPIADIRAIRIFIAIAAFYDYEIWNMDVKTAFLNGYLNEEVYMEQPEEVYMEQPEGFVNQKFPNRVCKLKHSIYGLKQAYRQWNKRFDDEIKKFGFNQNCDEPCVYVKASGSYVTFLILYVNDILIMGNNIPMLQDVKSYLGRCFAMKDLGEAAYILGIKIYRDRSKRLIGLCQSAYIKKIMKRFYMENSKRGTIPMQEKLKFSKSQGASTSNEIRRIQFQQNPGEVHWTAVKNILKYLHNTKDMFLVYRDAEYIATFDASKEAVWI
ncbi:retrotransposon protein, putative, ty1-copia subclass [Tanacetum coccineum]